jgi:rhodanese-related sulfurtransferase
MAMKLIYDKGDLSILGAQIVGRNGVDKRIDVLATAMAAGLRVNTLADLELAYAPPFSSAKDPVNMLGYMAENIASGACDVVGSGDVPALLTNGWQLIDVRTPEEFALGSISGARNVPLDELREQLVTLGDAPIVVFCAVGQRGHTAASLLGELGHRVRNLDGGYFTWRAFERSKVLAA